MPVAGANQQVNLNTLVVAVLFSLYYKCRAALYIASTTVVHVQKS